MELSLSYYKAQLGELLTAKHHASAFSTTRATYLRIRIVALCYLWAALCVLWIPVDALLLDQASAPLAILRLKLSAVLFFIGWLTSQRSTLNACRNAIFALVVSLNLFYVLTNHALGYPHSIDAFSYCYNLLPFVYVVILTILPLTVKESVCVMLIIAVSQIYVDAQSGALLSFETFTLYWLQTVVSFLVIWAQTSKLHMMLRLYRHATLDPLTGIYNRRMLLRLAKRDFENTRTKSRPYSVLLMDLDRFKRVNDRYGHHAGDIVLQAFTQAVQETQRKSDIFGRFGGEEFILFLPKCSADNAQHVANRIMARVRDMRIEVDGLSEPLKVTTSIGISTSLCKDDDLSVILEQADQALFKAKNSGRDQSSTYDRVDEVKEEGQKRPWLELVN
ncbi:GGDEF domain-containing protein [Grimontia sp. NTOU-MAR1]|uniref:GGDEF domain-containing protein n=1 Tax=Grimontia sp. NTOU-MAR1 TaxID=3111011 RepID=UPI002DBE18DB|nr:GGDEF domain-containing protein [Grimontia sp. NTOU-MAR1]WRV97984.1 GGDEF domain-containing protein [Grimontia sp. NTOU-MAR1]